MNIYCTCDTITIHLLRTVPSILHKYFLVILLYWSHGDCCWQTNTCSPHTGHIVFKGFHIHYNGFSIIWTLNYLNAWTKPCVWQQQKKDIRSGHWSSATRESKAAVWTTFSGCYNTFFNRYRIWIMVYNVRAYWAKLAHYSVRGLALHAWLGSACMAYSMAQHAWITVWQIKRQGKQGHFWLQSLTHDQLIVALVLFHQPCVRFQRPGNYFRSTKKWTLSKRPKKMLVRYDIMLQSLAHSSALLSVMSVVIQHNEI